MWKNSINQRIIILHSLVTFVLSFTSNSILGSNKVITCNKIKKRTNLKSYVDKWSSISIVSSSSYDKKDGSKVKVEGAEADGGRGAEDELNDWARQEAQIRDRNSEIEELVAQKERQELNEKRKSVVNNENQDTEEDSAAQQKLNVKEFEKSQEALKTQEGISLSVVESFDDIQQVDDERVLNDSINYEDEEQASDIEHAKPRKGIKVGSAGGWSLEVYPDDYVVHRKFGIGLYKGLSIVVKEKLTETEKAKQLKRRKLIVKTARSKNYTKEQIQKLVKNFGTLKDKDRISCPKLTVLNIEYADGTVNVPIERSYRLTRYRAASDAKKMGPKLSKVRGEAWSKAKSRVAISTLKLAQDVLALYAKRETYNRVPYPTSDSNNIEEMVNQFATGFPYEPTIDQASCFEAVENDMVYRTRPMDRLICGDVGFGKTEVALRALYRCVLDGRQAAFLSPTGVLAAQHYRTIESRFDGFNVTHCFLRGGMGNNTKIGRAIRAKIASGETNLIVGTHALLSNSISFRNLGLLVIDEEQRFGVQQKDRLKVLCEGIDVLTLTATPIPRTLQMSFTGIRDTSTIRSPPPMRKPVKTFVQAFQENTVKLAIETELQRGGQCFYVVPRIAQIEEAANTIMRLFPNIRLIKAHGRMSRHGAEENVAYFAEGKADVLLATTVIENGVDIPSTNTIIVQNAQAFGMSTLYQLRGRVGRSNQQAYAYFLHEDKVLSEASTARLQAMDELQHKLGSGFDVASRDLEIRGAGSLLGTEQSGMASKVGFDLYMRMLKKSIRQMKGLLDLPTVPRTNVLLHSANVDARVDSFSISESYIANNVERRKQEAAARLAESTDNIVELTTNWKETYGPLPISLQSQLKTLHLHACTRMLGIDILGLTPSQDNEGALDCIMRAPGLRPRHWAMICSSFPNQISTRGMNLVFPDRFINSGSSKKVLDSDEQQESGLIIVGGQKVNVQKLLNFGGASAISSNFEDDEDWDAFDQEEEEAMHEVSSVVKTKSINKKDIIEYPHIIIPNIIPASQENNISIIDTILKCLLPSTRVITKKLKENKEQAKVAAELREKREMMKAKQKEKLQMKKKNGYYY